MFQVLVVLLCCVIETVSCKRICLRFNALQMCHNAVDWQRRKLIEIPVLLIENNKIKQYLLFCCYCFYLFIFFLNLTFTSFSLLRLAQISIVYIILFRIMFLVKPVELLFRLLVEVCIALFLLWGKRDV